ncbi:hypothetical protein RIR_jg20590.t1 [Rhizophagus irregularis DAOM 181602=DAOM 197198]|nr:hypothetical protein RIR_jg20590.t1 [Rhizophagus irregularis DAOM 181602=DAOM 197198]
MVTPLETKLDFKDAGMEEGSGKHPTNGTKIHLVYTNLNGLVVFPGHEDCLPVDFKTFCLLILFFGKR